MTTQPQHAQVSETVTSCPMCGSYGTPLASTYSAVLGVCDVLVIKALETLGKRIMRAERSRYTRRGTTPLYSVHVLWQPDERMVDKALEGAWDAVPAVLGPYGAARITSADLTALLDDYTRTLVASGRGHSLDELRWRLEHLTGVTFHG